MTTSKVDTGKYLLGGLHISHNPFAAVKFWGPRTALKEKKNLRLLMAMFRFIMIIILFPLKCTTLPVFLLLFVLCKVIIG